MDFNYTAEQLAFRDEVRTFVRDHMPHEIARKVIEQQISVTLSHLTA